jgi:hypothetical protein
LLCKEKPLSPSHGGKGKNPFNTVAFLLGKEQHMSGAERRKYPRFDIELEMKNYLKNSGGEIPMRTKDISAKGIGCICDYAIPVGTEMDMWLHLPNGEPVRTEGKVSWIGRDGSRYRLGIDLVKEELKPIPIVLKSLQMRKRIFC